MQATGSKIPLMKLACLGYRALSAPITQYKSIVYFKGHRAYNVILITPIQYLSHPQL